MFASALPLLCGGPLIPDLWRAVTTSSAGRLAAFGAVRYNPTGVSWLGSWAATMPGMPRGVLLDGVMQSSGSFSKGSGEYAF